MNFNYTFIRWGKRNIKGCIWRVNGCQGKFPSHTTAKDCPRSFLHFLYRKISKQRTVRGIGLANRQSSVAECRQSYRNKELNTRYSVFGYSSIWWDMWTELWQLHVQCYADWRDYNHSTNIAHSMLQESFYNICPYVGWLVPRFEFFQVLSTSILLGLWTLPHRTLHCALIAFIIIKLI